jgi:hypothetical protein
MVQVKFVLRSFILLGFPLLITTQCKVIKYTPEKLPLRQIIFGDGGGFSGIETSYILLENGQLFKKSGLGTGMQELESVRKKQTEELFRKTAAIQLYKLDIHKPGNLYYFLQEVNEETDSRATWGSGDYLPPQNLVNVHRELLGIARNQSPHKNKKEKNAEIKPQRPEEDKNKW